ncbi:MAG: MFS transporter [Syntrophales bacterium LBB04]|nr:MFS transporter [Syntrophales bacterium LBB04]
MSYSNKTGGSSIPETNKPRFFYGYIIVLCSFLILMIAWGAQYSFGVFFKPMLKEFGFSRAVLSGAYSTNLIIQAIACIFTGKLSDKYGPRLVVTVCGACLGISYLLMSQTQELWQIYIIFGILASIGVAGTWVPLLSTISRWFVFRRGLMCGITAAGIGVGVMVMPPLSSYFISSFGWRTSYIIIGITVLVLIIISAQLLKRDPSQIGQSALGESDEQEDGSLSFTFREALRTRQFWLISGVYLLMAACMHSVLVHIVPHATDVGIAEVTAASIISVIGAVSIITKVVVGIAIDRLGNKPVALLITSFMLISLLIIQFSNALWVFYVFAVFFAIGYGGFAAIQSPYLAELFGLKYHGTIFGFTFFILGAAAFGPFVAGKIFDVTASYQLAFVMLAILSFVAILFAGAIKKTDLHSTVRKK